MTARPETCRWQDWFPRSFGQDTECGRVGNDNPSWHYCPHCGGRIVRDQPKEAS